MKASLTEAWPITRQVGPDGVLLKKQGPSHHLDRSGSLILCLHLTAGSYGNLIWPFKTSLCRFDLTLMADLAESSHHPDGLECSQWALMTKLGGRPPSPLVLHWQGVGGAAPSSLSPPSSEQKWNFTG